MVFAYWAIGDKKMEKIKIIRWPDGTEVPFEDFNYEKDWAWKSDDFVIIYIDSDEYDTEQN